MLNTKIGGRYQIVREMGGGGFGQTYLAQDLQLPDHDYCVVKKLQPQASDEFTLQTARRLFDAEARALHRLGKHDQIPQLLAHFEENHEFFLVQEYIEGEPLDRELARGGLASLAEVLDFLTDVLGILDFVHQQNVIHRDIKPSNLIRRKKDGKFVLIDFGAVKQIYTEIPPQPTGKPSVVTVAIGTAGYMPNEQANGKPKPNSDIYAVGIIAVQALTGLLPAHLPEDPHTGEINWQDLTRNPVPRGMCQILDKMIRTDFRQRYQTARDILLDIEALRSQSESTHLLTQVLPEVINQPTLAVTPEPTSLSAPPPASPPRKWWLISGIGAVIMVALLTWGLGIKNTTEQSVVNNASNDVPTDPRSPKFLASTTLTAEDLKGKSDLELNLIVNTVFAKYGRKFEDQALQQYFDRQPWYQPRFEPQEFPANLLDPLERQNVEFIRAFQRRRRKLRTDNPDICPIALRIVADLEAPLNVRTGAGKEFPVVGQLENGTRIVMTQAVKGWIKINSPIEGWVAFNRTEPFCFD